MPKENFKLLVESPNDLHFITHLFEKATKQKVGFEIINCENISKLLDSIPARLLESGTQKLGIVIDADEDLLKRWKEVSKKFVANGYPLNELPQADGEIITGPHRKPTIGIWVMPNNLKTGILEDFIIELIPQGDDLQPFAEKILSEIEEKSLKRYPERYHSKALIHTWLAWQDEPGKPFGWAVTKRYFDIDALLAQKFINWLNRLFNE